MVQFADELVRESAVFTSSTVLTLGGAVANHIKFSEAKRRDGAAVQSGDRACVGVVQAGVGFAVCMAQLTLGAEAKLTLDASKIFQSSAGASLPGFSAAGAAAEVYITNSVDLIPSFDENGVLLSPDKFRKTIVPEKIVNGFLSELGTVDNEGVIALGVDSAFDGLAGLFGMDAADSTTEDGIDVFENDHTSTGRVKRLSLKPWPTKRGNAIPDGNAYTLYPASTAGEKRLVAAWTADGSAAMLGFVIGHATNPQIFPIYERGNIKFDESGTNVQVRNLTGGSVTINSINPVIG